MGKSLLITGGAGYLGSHILHRLVGTKSQFDQIDIIDDLSTGFLPAIPKSIFDTRNSPIQFHHLDLRCENSCRSFFMNRRFDTIIHLAGKLKVSESVAYPTAYYESNVNGLVNLLKQLPTHQTTHFIFSSTSAVYGNSATHSPIPEDFKLSPTSPYGHSKLMCEQLLKDYASANSGFKFISLRYFNIAGAADDLQNGQRTANAYHLVHVAAKVALGLLPVLQIFGDKRSTKDGTCIRDYIHVEDLVDLHLLAIEFLLLQRGSHIFNCGYQNETSVKDVVLAMEQVLGAKLNVTVTDNRPGDPDYAVASSQRLMSEFGWRPQRNDILMICKSALDWERKLFTTKL